VTCAICWGRCSLIGLLVVMSVLFVLVLLFINFPVDGVGVGRCNVINSFLVLVFEQMWTYRKEILCFW